MPSRWELLVSVSEQDFRKAVNRLAKFFLCELAFLAANFLGAADIELAALGGQHDFKFHFVLLGCCGAEVHRDAAIARRASLHSYGSCLLLQM
jgi:hypothetical protein